MDFFFRTPPYPRVEFTPHLCTKMTFCCCLLCKKAVHKEHAQNVGVVYGEGTSAIVSPVGPGTVVKVFKKGEVSLREIDVLRRVSGHSHLPSLISYDIDRIVMTDAGPQCLVGWITTHHSASDRRACDGIASDVASALMHMHSLCIVHLDVKADNVVVDLKGRATLIDFNLSHIYGDMDQEYSMYRYAGSSSYVAPEISGGWRYSGYKADVWSYGILFTALCFKRLPFNHCDENRCRAFQEFMTQTTQPFDTLCNMYELFRNGKDIRDMHINVINACLYRNPFERGDMTSVVREIHSGR